MDRIVFFSCGDVSGDLYVGEMIRLFRQRFPGVTVFALGGEESENAGAKLLCRTVSFSTFGLWELIGSLRRWREIWDSTAAWIRENRPRVMVLVDNPGFNFRLARLAQNLGIPVVYFAPPQVWAWGRRRGMMLSKLADWIFPLFPWEVEYFLHGKAQVEWAGHPIVEFWRRWEKEARVDEEKESWVVLLPGSRKAEVLRYLAVVRQCLRESSTFFGPDPLVVVAASEDFHALLRKRLEGFPVKLAAKHELPLILRNARLAISCAGTVTLEVALAGVPQIIVYRLSPVTFWIARMVFRGSQVGLPNIVLGEDTAPELIQSQFSPKNLRRVVDAVLVDHTLSEKSRYWAGKIRERLDRGNPFERVVEVLGTYL